MLILLRNSLYELTKRFIMAFFLFFLARQSLASHTSLSSLSSYEKIVGLTVAFALVKANNQGE